MTFRSYYDPHYKPDRTAAKYKADKNRDATSARETAEYVQKFLKRWRGNPKVNEDPAGTFRALRVEMRNLNLRSRKKPEYQRPDKIQRTKKRKRGKGASANPSGASPWERNKPQATGRPRLKRQSSLKYWKSENEQLLIDYVQCEDKIEAWRAERKQAVDARRKAVLADQIQVQLEIRQDLLIVLHERALSWM